MRYFLQLAYDGTNYHGWQIQPNAISVQEVLDKALSTLCGEAIYTLGCGRTDTGVHAKDFYAHFDTSKELDDRLIINLNGILPDDIAAKRFIKLDDQAHARFDATQRSYEYHMHFHKDPFKNGYSYYFPYQRKPDVHLMNEAAKYLLEVNDFACFSKAHAGAKTTICKVTRAEWQIIDDNTIVFHISADRFLRNMVRAIVGTLIDVGNGKLTSEDLKKIIESKNRSMAGTSVPGNGLYLCEIKYPYI
jgi:tRNA pseudouridine38-40 synthase